MKPGVKKISRTLLYEQVAGQIRELIKSGDLWGSYLPSERDLAAGFGVSQVTVRKGLAELAREGLVHRKHGQGTRVAAKPASRRRRGATRVVVAARWTEVASGYLGQIMSGLGLGASRHEWNVSFRNMAETQGRQSLLGSLREGGVGGLILLSVSDRNLGEEILRIWNGPAVLIDHYFEDLALTSVTDDSRLGALESMRHLLSLGHRRIAYLACSRREQNPWRHDGYVEALAEAGLKPDRRLEVSCTGNSRLAEAAAGKLLDGRNAPTAFLAFDHRRALGIFRAAEERGLVVGRDLAVVAFASTKEPDMPRGLSCVEMNWHQAGETAAAELAGMMSGETAAGRRVLLPGRLVIRESSDPSAVEDNRGPGEEA